MRFMPPHREANRKVDLVVTALSAPAEIWMNDSPNQNHWLELTLGKAERADEIEIRWPSGTVQTVKSVTADQVMTIREPK